MQIPTHKIDGSELFIKWRDIRIVPDTVEQAHRHDYYQFMFLEEVNGKHEIDFKDYDSSDRSLHFVGKGRIHKVEFAPQVVGGVFLFPEALFAMSAPDMKLLYSLTYFQAGAYPVLQLNHDEFIMIRSMIENLKLSLARDPLEISKYMLFALLASVREIYASKESMDQGAVKDKLPVDLIRFNNLLERHAKEWNTIDLFLEELPLGVARLNQLCRKQYGKTALQLLHARKLLAAKRMLVYTDKQVKEIAYDCGFSDVAYFNRFFKKHVGETPLGFRRKH